MVNEPKTQNFLDRAAFYDGKVAAMELLLARLLAAIDTFGTPPPPTASFMEIALYQASTTQKVGRVFTDMHQELSKALLEAKAERERLEGEKEILIDGAQVH